MAGRITTLMRGLPRHGRVLQPRSDYVATRTAVKQFSTASTAASGPPFKKFFWITTGVMFGIPSVIGAAFVYNLKTDKEFYDHFNDKYPDLIEAINEYVSLNERDEELARRTDIGDVESTQEIQNETITVVAELLSRKIVRFQVKGSTSQAEIEQQALSHSFVPNDRVIAINFDEDATNDSTVVEEKTDAAPTLTTQAAWPPQPRVTWGSARKAAASPKQSVKQIRDEIESIRVQQAALEEAKYAGRDIDECDEEIQVLEVRKTELKAQLPRKRFLYIF